MVVPKLRRLVASFLARRSRFEPKLDHVRFVCFLLPIIPLTSHYSPPETGSIRQIVADVLTGLSLTTPQETKKNINYRVVIFSAFVKRVQVY
jgi:hypothetical protein